MKKRLLLLVAGAAVPLLGMEPTQANKQQKKNWSKKTTQFLSYFTHCALKQSDYEKALEELAKLGFTFNLHDQHYKTTIEKILFDVMLPECVSRLDGAQDLRPFIDQQAAAGKDWAIKIKIEGLDYGSYGYGKNEAELREFIEQCVAAGNDSAIQMKINGLSHGWYGYEENEAAAREFIEPHAAAGNHWATEVKFHSLRIGANGYEKNEAAAHELIKQCVAAGKDWAIMMKIEGLTYGWYGYEENEAAVHELIEQYVAAGNDWIIKKKLACLLYGWKGYEKNEAAASEFIDQQVALGSKYAVQVKIRGNHELPEKLLPILQTLAEKVYAMPQGLITLLEIEERTKFEKNKRNNF